MMPPLSRRAFLAGAACSCCRPAFAQGSTARLALFERGEVRLLEGPLRDQFDYQQALFLGLDDDALLKPFRQRAGLPAPGGDLGGWYDDSPDFHCEQGDPHVDFHGYIPGHSFGQYVSGLARGFAASRDPRVQAKLKGLIEVYGATISPRFFEDYNLPAYTFDKLVVGLIDAGQEAGISLAKPVLDKLTDIALPYLPEKALTREEMQRRPHSRWAQTWDESYTLPENLLLAYERGFGDRYRTLGARYIQDQELFSPLARGENVLGGQHAYSHVNALSSAVQSYLTLGDERYLRAAMNGFAMIERQSYATGGWGPDETLAGDDGGAALVASLSKTHNNFETPCGAYGHFKIARHLLRLTGDSRYADSMERVLYNTVLGAKATEPDGRTFYYSDYAASGAKKDFHWDRWPCCSGSFVQLAADYGISAYLAGGDCLYVALYIPSEVKGRLAGQEVVLTQETDYPRDNKVRFRLGLSSPARFALAFRIPGWAGPATRLTVNGRPETASLKAGRFARIERFWRPDDRVELEIDQPMRLEAIAPSRPDLVALMRGPRALFAVSALETRPTRAALLAARPDPAKADSWRAGDIRLSPFTAIGDEPYRLYSEITA